MKLYKINKTSNKVCDLLFFNRLKSIIKNPKRVFFLKAKKNCLRGNHAHKICTQYFFSINGVIQIEVDNKHKKKTFMLKNTELLEVKPLNWVKIKLKKNQILGVFCNTQYKRNEYIRDYKIFKNFKKK